jgi:hypothetical protein
MHMTQMHIQNWWFMNQMGWDTGEWFVLGAIGLVAFWAINRIINRVG